MAITVNKDLKEQRIQSEVDRFYSEIESNAANGNEYTEIYIEKDIAGTVRDRVEKKLTDEGTNYTFLILSTRRNPYSGKMDNFSSETIGNVRRYKVKILN